MVCIMVCITSSLIEQAHSAGATAVQRSVLAAQTVVLGSSARTSLGHVCPAASVQVMRTSRLASVLTHAHMVRPVTWLHCLLPCRQQPWTSCTIHSLRTTTSYTFETWGCESHVVQHQGLVPAPVSALIQHQHCALLPWALRSILGVQGAFSASRLDRAAFVAWLESNKVVLTAGRAEYLFTRFDSNSDGEVDVREYVDLRLTDPGDILCHSPTDVESAAVAFPGCPCNALADTTIGQCPAGPLAHIHALLTCSEQGITVFDIWADAFPTQHCRRRHTRPHVSIGNERLWHVQHDEQTHASTMQASFAHIRLTHTQPPTLGHRKRT